MAKQSQKISDNQLPLLNDVLNDDHILGTRVFNVASVPQRSIFRYPGGKTWFVPYLRKWLKALPEMPIKLIEPFAGGGIVGLTAVFENLAKTTVIVELDPQIAAVWQTILSVEASWLVDRIIKFKLTEKNIETVLTDSPSSIRDKAFQTILKNRINRGGILAAGAGRIKAGENGKGLASRWYPQTLGKRILDIAAIKDRIHFIEGDGIEIMRNNNASENVAFFIDPPYTAGGKRAGSRLYTYSEIDHKALFAVTEQLKGSFLMTYDDTKDVRVLAQTHNFNIKNVAMKNTHHAQMTELLISRDLDWLDLH
jgi:DNA adenine methylase